MTHALMILAGILISLLEGIATMVPYRRGKYRRIRRGKRAKKDDQ